MLRKTCLLLSLATLLSSPIVIAHPDTALGNDITPPPVPPNLDVPAGRPLLIGHASGTQNYICLPTGTGVAWSFLGPQATVFDSKDEQLTTHFLSPNPAENGTPRATWQHSRDTSTVWAVAIGSSTDPVFVAPGAIPWLLLRVTGAQHGPAGDKLSQTTYIQRVNTAGGLAPANGCSGAADAGRRALVPYSADYIFYRE